MSKKKKILTGSMAAFMLLGASSLAHFTDRTEDSITGQAGSLCVNLDYIEGDLSNLAPGDVRDIDLAFSSTGSLAMDTRVTYAVSYALNPEIADALNEDEYYTRGEGALDKIATLRIGDEELVVHYGDTPSITVDGGTLNGTDENVAENDVIEQALEFEFDKSVSNIGQLMKFKIDVIVEGKQHRNDATWDVLNKTSFQVYDDWSEIEYGSGLGQFEVVEESHCKVEDDWGDDEGDWEEDDAPEDEEWGDDEEGDWEEDE